MARRPLALLVVLLAPLLAAQDDLERGFTAPPAVARPHTWWHWMNGNITKAGITADLEAMRAVGLGGAQIFNVSESIPDGPAPFMSPQWRELLTFAVQEADRLGLELCMHNCAGWSSSGGPWIQPEQAMQKVVLSELQLSGPGHTAAAMPQPETRHGFYRDIAVLAFPKPPDAARRIADAGPKAGYEARYGIDPALDVYPPAAVIARNQIVDVTDRLTADGTLSWDVPAGNWTVLRFGYTPTGAVNAPSPVSGRGLECDKLSRAGMDAHWQGFLAPVLQDLGPLAGKTLRNLLIDSYEVGAQNWTASFRHEFTRRRGYDPLPLLPAMTGRVVDSGEVTERFLWDLRRTISDLFADNYYDHFAELCHQHGLIASIEPYDGPFECLQVGRGADIPMGEFWVGSGESSSCKLAASVAHLGGRALVGAESFTAGPGNGRWQNHPATLKAVGDLMYCTGINRYIIHRYAHQPWLDVVPGMTMGQWGTHFERTTTWWTQGAAWLQYLARCQFLLQQGRFVADVIYCLGEDAPNGAPLHPECKTAGYDYDSCGADAVLAMTVVDGRLVHPSGMSYRVLVLPDSPFMTTRLAAKVKALVEAGATVIGRRPERSPSLAEYGAGDEAVRAMGMEVWGDEIGEHAFGKGRAIAAAAPFTVLAAAEVAPDFAAADATHHKLAWIHRRAGDADLWFVSNQKSHVDEVTCSFRVAGKAPELWHADTGVIEPAPVWSERAGVTTVPIRFDPTGSVFVVFRKPATANHLLAVAPPASDTTAPRRPVVAITKALYEAIDGAGGADVTAKVAAMVAAGDLAIPADNNTFGDPSYLHRKRLRVEFTVDGKAMTRSADENEVLELVRDTTVDEPAPFALAVGGDGKVELRAYTAGAWQLRTADGAARTLHVDTVPAPLPIPGPWTLRFPPGLGAPAEVKLDRLLSWTEHADPGVRYFSGTAEYSTTFELTAEACASHRLVTLDLGLLKALAEVTLNGKSLGVWWKPPFAADVTGVVHPGHNELQVRITNLWVNRLIGDEQFPDDSTWNGIALEEWPAWFVNHTPRPVPQRFTFTTWKHWTKGAEPLESGLLGPVQLRLGVRVAIE